MGFVAELKQFEVLQSGHILTIRNYIEKKYPTYSTQQHSIILADAINKVIDEHIPYFTKEIRDQVKFEVLQKAVINNNYDICGSDIFRACLYIKDTGENFNSSLIDWLNKNCCTPIIEKQLELLLTKVANSYHEYVNYELDYIISNSEQNVEIGNSSTLIDTSYSGEYFVDRLRTTYDYLNGKISIKGIPYHILVATLLLSVSLSTFLFVGRQDNIVIRETIQEQNPIKEQQMSELQYRQIDKNSLLQYLSKRESLLCEEPYFSSIIQASQEYDLNPLVLFAIAGQEQAYVPKNEKDAKLIANNPFNVFGSWQKYNTDILDSSRIAANFIVTLSENRPSSIDPLVWINTKYAEDKTWNVGVRKLLEELDKEVKVVQSVPE
ncbi:MAG: hypothetical protein ACYC25_14320 [Paludibacter sp.]